MSLLRLRRVGGQDRGESPADLVRRDPDDQESLPASGLAREDLDLRRLETERPGEHILDRGIGLPLLGRRRDRDAERPGMEADDRIPPRPGLGADREDRPEGMGGQVDHGTTPSNSAEPTRTRVAPSSIAASKSPDIPIESSASSSEVRSPSRSRSARSPANDLRRSDAGAS